MTTTLIRGRIRGHYVNVVKNLAHYNYNLVARQPECAATCSGDLGRNWSENQKIGSLQLQFGAATCNLKTWRHWPEYQKIGSLQLQFGGEVARMSRYM